MEKNVARSVRNRVVRFILMAILVSTGVLTIPVSSAAAGTNGQILYIVTNCSLGVSPKIVNVTVKGVNQYDKYVVWSAWPNASAVVTAGWWWKGNVEVQYLIHYINRANFAATRTFNVPVRMNDDYYVAPLIC